MSELIAQHEAAGQKEIVLRRDFEEFERAIYDHQDFPKKGTIGRAATSTVKCEFPGAFYTVLSMDLTPEVRTFIQRQQTEWNKRRDLTQPIEEERKRIEEDLGPVVEVLQLFFYRLRKSEADSMFSRAVQGLQEFCSGPDEAEHLVKQASRIRGAQEDLKRTFKTNLSHALFLKAKLQVIAQS